MTLILHIRKRIAVDAGLLRFSGLLQRRMGHELIAPVEMLVCARISFIMLPSSLNTLHEVHEYPDILVWKTLLPNQSVRLVLFLTTATLTFHPVLMFH